MRQHSLSCSDCCSKKKLLEHFVYLFHYYEQIQQKKKLNCNVRYIVYFSIHNFSLTGNDITFACFIQEDLKKIIVRKFIAYFLKGIYIQYNIQVHRKNQTKKSASKIFIYHNFYYFYLENYIDGRYEIRNVCIERQTDRRKILVLQYNKLLKRLPIWGTHKGNVEKYGNYNPKKGLYLSIMDFMITNKYYTHELHVFYQETVVPYVHNFTVRRRM